MAGFLSKAISEQKARTRPDADEGNGSYMVPTSMACPAAGCPFPCDTGRNGRFLCSFHTGVQSQYWPLVTEILQRYWAVWQMAIIHYQCFNDLEAATEVIHQINADPVMRAAGIEMLSEAEMKAMYGRGSGHFPLDIISTMIHREIEVGIAKKRERDAGKKQTRLSAAERVRSLCQRIGHRAAPMAEPV